MKQLHYRRPEPVSDPARLEEILLELYPELTGLVTLVVDEHDVWLTVPDAVTPSHIDPVFDQYDAEKMESQQQGIVFMRASEIAGMTYAQVADIVRNRFSNLTEEQQDYLITRDQLLLAILKYLL